MTPSDFISRWSASSGAERANKDSFLLELCDVLGVPRPAPTTGDPQRDLYVLEADAVTVHSGGRTTIGKMDLYRKGAFILEAKQGSDAGALKLGTARRGTSSWAVEMERAYGQAIAYAQTLDDRPPFLVVCDIGYCFDLYASFDGSPYRPFPDARNRRLFLSDLPNFLDLLRQVWSDPRSLDPSLRKARVTRTIAGHLAELAQQLERRGHEAQRVAKFLMRCLFTMFAEDAGLLPPDVFKDALEKHWRTHPDRFAPELESLWLQMDKGGYFFGIGKILKFNGALFAEAQALPLQRSELDLLYQAALCDWRDVEPAIFGTLLEQALDPTERHALGAHYTPRPYVERLVRPTVEEPLRAEWEAIRAAAVAWVGQGKEAQARETVGAFHLRLCELRVLDPACGTGNFLYVALDLLKRLEGEVLELLQDLGDTQAVFGRRVGPRQFLGIEKKPWAREIADLVLWVGYLSAQLRNLGKGRQIAEPVLEKLDNIQCRDAVLTWTSEEPLLDAQGQPLSRWDGVTTKKHPITGEDVPDDSARVPLTRLIDPRPADWPQADFVVGNPPFIGTKRMRQALGDGYVNALRTVYGADVQDNADLVMYWWHKAACLLESGSLRRFGLITTNSINQMFNRRVVDNHLDKNVKIVWAIPDHPWVSTDDGAAVRIAMTVSEINHGEAVSPIIEHVIRETPVGDTGAAHVLTQAQAVELIHSDLKGGVTTSKAMRLLSNEAICSMGVALHGSGFILGPEDAQRIRVHGPEAVVKYVGGKDLLQVARERYLIDFSFCTEQEARSRNLYAFQHVIDYVKPERDENRRAALQQRWWRFGWERPILRRALRGLNRFIGTTETAKHRVFQFVAGDVLPDHMVVVVATEDAYHLGVLSSRFHVIWALAAGGTLEDRPRYTKSRCFEPFPFPDPSPANRQHIAQIAENLDAHRKRQQALHPELTLTGMYNVLEALREGRVLNEKEQILHQWALTSVLKELHDSLDEAVAAAYGWPATLDDEGILERLVALNAERAQEEANGQIRYLRPEFQNPAGSGQQAGLGLEAADEAPLPKNTEKVPWPGSLPQQVAALRTRLGQSGESTVEQLSAAFQKAPKKELLAILELLCSLGMAVALPGKRWCDAGR